MTSKFGTDERRFHCTQPEMGDKVKIRSNFRCESFGRNSRKNCHLRPSLNAVGWVVSQFFGLRMVRLGLLGVAQGLLN